MSLVVIKYFIQKVTKIFSITILTHIFDNKSHLSFYKNNDDILI